VFDTLLAHGGVALDLELHVGRLTASVVELYGAVVDAGALADRIRTHPAVADTRGGGHARVRTSYDPATGECDVAAESIAKPSSEPRTLGVRRLDDGLGAHKWVDRRLVRAPEDVDDVLLVDAAGLVLECGSANLFAVVGEVVTTPPLDGRILRGTVRAVVLELLRAREIPVTERPLGLDELATATEVFTTSSVRGVQPVVACEGIGTWAPGPRAAWLRDRLADRR
jgi:para-aminobenzoate synthetase/4-amino-4-deoxychorismate lyase